MPWPSTRPAKPFGQFSGNANRAVRGAWSRSGFAVRTATSEVSWQAATRRDRSRTSRLRGCLSGSSDAACRCQRVGGRGFRRTQTHLRLVPGRDGARYFSHERSECSELIRRSPCILPQWAAPFLRERSARRFSPSTSPPERRLSHCRASTMVCLASVRALIKRVERPSWTSPPLSDDCGKQRRGDFAFRRGAK